MLEEVVGGAGITTVSNAQVAPRGGLRPEIERHLVILLGDQFAVEAASFGRGQWAGAFRQALDQAGLFLLAAAEECGAHLSELVGEVWVGGQLLGACGAGAEHAGREGRSGCRDGQFLYGASTHDSKSMSSSRQVNGSEWKPGALLFTR